MTDRRLIVNADDYGLTPGVSRGILEAHHKGIVTSTSVMIGSPGAANAVREAISAAPDLGLGLHLTLSGPGCRPVLPADQVTTLVKLDGTFYPFEEWLTHYEQFSPDEIAREIVAQVECFAQAASKLPDHLDAHHHVIYRHPAGLRTAFDLAQRHHIPVRNPGFDSPAAFDDLFSGIAEPVREVNRAAIRQLLNGPVPAWPDHFADSFYDATATLGDLLLILVNLTEGVTELMCHPGYADETLQSDYTTKREAEVAALTHVSARELIRSEGITLTNYAVLQAA